MKQLTLLFLLIFSLNKTKAQDNFEWQHPLPSGHYYSDVQLINNNSIVAVGLRGTFVRSDNGGTNWTHHYTQTLADLRGVFFVNSDTGYVCGETNSGPAPHLMKTTDGGQTWDSIYISSSEDLYDVTFINQDTGWVVGNSGTIYCTHDGGSTWISQSIVTFNAFYSIYMLNSTTGFIGGYNGSIYKTTDGGNNWTPVSTGITKTILDFSFINDSTGWLSTSGETIRKTIDGGLTWTLQYNTGNATDITGIHMLDSSNGFACSQSYIYRTSNGGTTWNDDNNFFHQPVALDMNASGKAVMVGLYGCIQTSVNSGLTWTSNAGQSNFYNYQEIFFSDKTHGWCVGEGGRILRTINGTTWSTLSSSGPDYLDVHFVDNTTGYVVGEFGTVKKTIDGGLNWTNVNIPTSTTLYSVFFITPQTGWAGGLNSTLYRTINGGISWTQQTLPTSTFNVDDIYFVDLAVGYIAGWQNKFYKTTNSGGTWTQMSTVPSINNGMKVQFLNADTGFISSSFGYFTKTTDGGNTWTNTFQFTFSPVYGMHFYDINNGFCGGGTVNWDSKMFRTSDGGTTWQNTHLPFAYDINGLYMTDTNSVYVCGDYGSIIHYGDSVSPVISNIETVTDEAAVITVSPNPASEQIYITCNQLITEMQIKDITGRTCISGNYHSSELIVNTSGLNESVYIVCLKLSSGNMHTQKIVLRR